jgi:hypothetical protein
MTEIVSQHPVLLAHDEMNLAENPLAWLTDRPDPSIKTLEFNYPLKGKRATWTITGSDKYGLPLPGDDDILLILIQIAQERGLEDRTLPIDRQDVLRRLKGDKKRFSGPEYQRIQDALLRIQGTQIVATHWYNYRLRRHVTFAGGILDDVVIVEETPGRRSRRGQLPLSYIVWNEQFFNSLRDGYVRAIDLEKYLSFSRPLTKKLYRFLDKKFYDKKPKFEMNLRVLAHEHLGVQRGYRYDSDLKKTMKPAHEDLVRIGFVREVEYRKTSEGIIVVYHRGDDDPAVLNAPLALPSEIEADEEPSALDQALTDQLVEAGISPARVAEDLVERFPERIPLALQYLTHDYLVKQKGAARPPAYLRTIIEADWFDLEIQEARRWTETARKSRRPAEAARKPPKSREEKEPQSPGRAERLVGALQAVSLEERAALTGRAEAMARERHPHPAKLADRGKGLKIWKNLVQTELERLVLGEESGEEEL